MPTRPTAQSLIKLLHITCMYVDISLYLSIVTFQNQCHIFDSRLFHFPLWNPQKSLLLMRFAEMAPSLDTSKGKDEKEMAYRSLRIQSSLGIDKLG